MVEYRNKETKIVTAISTVKDEYYKLALRMARRVARLGNAVKESGAAGFVEASRYGSFEFARHILAEQRRKIDQYGDKAFVLSYNQKSAISTAVAALDMRIGEPTIGFSKDDVMDFAFTVGMSDPEALMVVDMVGEYMQKAMRAAANVPPDPLLAVPTIGAPANIANDEFQDALEGLYIDLKEIAGQIVAENEEYDDSFRKALALVRSGAIPSVKRNGKYYAIQRDVNSWINAHLEELRY